MISAKNLGYFGARRTELLRRAPKLGRRFYGLVSDSPGDKSKKSRSRQQHSMVFLPNEPVPETGIYEVLHDKKHRTNHEVMLRAKDVFPPCDQCGTRVRFKVVRTAPYIFDDEDFMEGV